MSGYQIVCSFKNQIVTKELSLKFGFMLFGALLYKVMKS